MSWTDDQLERLRTRMVEARRQGAWISAGEASLVSTLIQAIRRLTRATGWSGIPQGRLPTIGDVRKEGVTSFTVTCATPQCWQSRRFSFDEIGLADNVTFADIPKMLPEGRWFRCRKCDSNNVTVMANWKSPLGPAPAARGWENYEDR